MRNIGADARRRSEKIIARQAGPKASRRSWPRSIGCMGGTIVQPSMQMARAGVRSDTAPDLPAQTVEVGVDHFADHRFERYFGYPIELLPRLACIAAQGPDLCGAKQTAVAREVFLGRQSDMTEGDPAKIENAHAAPGGDHEIFGLAPLQHQPHRPNVVAR